MTFDGAGGDFQGPVAAQAGAVGGRGDIAPGQLRQGIDKVDALVAGGGVTGVDQDIAAHVHVLADLRQHFAAGRDVVGGQIGIAQPQVTGIAVGDDLHRADALMAAQVIGDLLQAVPAGIQLHHLGAGGDALEQFGGILHAGIDKHHALPRHGNRCGGGGRVGLRVAFAAGGGAFGGRRRLGCGICGGGGVAVSLGRIGHSGGHGAVEQHARFQGHNHRRRQGAGIGCCWPCLNVVPPHAAHPSVEY